MAPSGTTRRPRKSTAGKPPSIKVSHQREVMPKGRFSAKGLAIQTEFLTRFSKLLLEESQARKVASRGLFATLKPDDIQVVLTSSPTFRPLGENIRLLAPAGTINVHYARVMMEAQRANEAKERKAVRALKKRTEAANAAYEKKMLARRAKKPESKSAARFVDPATLFDDE